MWLCCVRWVSAGIQIGMDIFIVRNSAVVPYLRDGLHRDAQLPVLPPEVTRIEVMWMAEDDVVRMLSLLRAGESVGMLA